MVFDRLISSFSTGRKACFVLDCRPVQGRFLSLQTIFMQPMSEKRVCNLSNPKPGHTRSVSGRSAQRSGRAGSGKIKCKQNYAPRKQKSTVPSKASKKRRFNVSPETRTSEILCKPTEEQNQRLTTGLSAVYHRDEKRALFLAAEQWNDALLCL